MKSKLAGLGRVLKYTDSGGFLVSGLAYTESGSLGSSPHNKKTAEQTENRQLLDPPENLGHTANRWPQIRKTASCGRGQEQSLLLAHTAPFTQDITFSFSQKWEGRLKIKTSEETEQASEPDLGQAVVLGLSEGI